MTKRRPKGDGSFTKRKDGRWQASLTIGYDAAGKQVRKYVVGRTQAEARSKLDALKREHHAGRLTIEDSTAATYLDRWLVEKRRQVKSTTYESYRYTVTRYLLPRIGSKKLTKLTPLTLQTALGEIADEVSPGTANYARFILRSALDQAVKWQLIPNNPVAAVPKFREEKHERSVWTTEQTRAFLNAAKDEDLYPLIYLAISTGLRIGELLALRWSDLKDGKLHVRHTLTKEDGQLKLASTKTNRSERIVALAPEAIEVLGDHRAKQAKAREALGDAWAHPEHMFTTAIGTYLDVSNVRRSWNAIEATAGVPHARLHDARHLHASMLIRHGLDARTVADRLGHTNPAFTMKQYTHAFEEQRLKAAVPLTALLGSATSRQED